MRTSGTSLAGKWRTSGAGVVRSVDADVKGAAICKVLAERGARVAVNYSASPDRAEETRASLAGQGHVIIQGDVFTHEGVDALVAGTIKALGGIDFIVSNAGWTKFGPYSDISESGDADLHHGEG